jgi:hypothetical protein
MRLFDLLKSSPPEKRRLITGTVRPVFPPTKLWFAIGLSGAVAAAFFVSSTAHAENSYTTLDAPAAGNPPFNGGTSVTGISGSNIFGTYSVPNGSSQGFIYNGVTYTDINVPFPSTVSTGVSGISGDQIVGDYTTEAIINGTDTFTSNGFLYSGGAYTTIDDPLGSTTGLSGISDGNIVGEFQEGDTFHGFLYNGSSYITIDDPLGVETFVRGISGSDIVGFYTDANGNCHGFLYNGSTYSTIDHPGAEDGSTKIFGISGGDIVGFYTDASLTSHGFYYDGDTYTDIDDPSAVNNSTLAYGVDGNAVVETYYDANNTAHGFETIISPVPETASPLLTSAGAAGLIWLRRKRRMESQVET